MAGTCTKHMWKNVKCGECMGNQMEQKLILISCLFFLRTLISIFTIMSVPLMMDSVNYSVVEQVSCLSQLSHYGSFLAYEAVSLLHGASHMSSSCHRIFITYPESV